MRADLQAWLIPQKRNGAANLHKRRLFFAENDKLNRADYKRALKNSRSYLLCLNKVCNASVVVGAAYVEARADALAREARKNGDFCREMRDVNRTNENRTAHAFCDPFINIEFVSVERKAQTSIPKNIESSPASIGKKWLNTRKTRYKQRCLDSVFGVTMSNRRLYFGRLHLQNKNCRLIEDVEAKQSHQIDGRTRVLLPQKAHLNYSRIERIS